MFSFRDSTDLQTESVRHQVRAFHLLIQQQGLPDGIARRFPARQAVECHVDLDFVDLRHTAARLLIAQGATLHEVKEILGRSQIRLTGDLHWHAYVQAKREIVSKIEDVLAPGSSLAASLAPSSRKPRPARTSEVSLYK
jgi:hypothetical protein